MSPPDTPEPFVFLSYAAADRDRVLDAAGRLRAAGVRVWLDEDGAASGAQIAEALKTCRAVAVVCSAAAFQARNVRQEIQLAWKYERPYLSLLLEDVAFPDEFEYRLEGAPSVVLLDHPAEQWLPPALDALMRLGVTALLATEPPAAAPATATSVPPDGERKLVTMLFADVVDSTPLGERMDPEELRLILNEAQTGMIQAVTRFGGHITSLPGDGLVALFGAPAVHEDDAERAVRAALAIIDQVRVMSDDLRRAWGIENFQVRVGLNTGEVAVGDFGSDLHAEYTAIGDAVNLAARIQSAAPPGGVLISAATYRHVQTRIEARPLGPITVKGREQPVEVYEVTGLRAAAGRTHGVEGLGAPLVGRDHELETLRESLTALLDGHGQIVAVIGEAGIGKSRVVEEARASMASRTQDSGLRTQDFHWLEGRSLSYGGALPFWAVTQLLKADMGLSDGDPDARVRVALRRRSAALFGDDAGDVMPFLAHLMAQPLDAEATERLRGLDTETLKRQALHAVREYVVRLADERPTVLVFEDLHWADPSTLEALEALLPLTDQTALMVLMLFRPEREHGCWRTKLMAETEYGHRYTEVTLRPLSAGDAARLVEHLLDIPDLPERLRALILDRAEGNPFYVEEIVRSLIEQGAVVRDPATGGWRATAEVADITVPDTLQGVLLARIDRLEEDVRRTLQLASVIGRSFLYRLLAAIAEAERRLDEQLLQLQRAELVREKTRRPELEFIFKHSLTQEAAYNSLLLERRRQFHRRVGEAMERLFADRLAEFYGLLAHHYAAAGVREKALDYLTRAGETAADRSATEEALDYFNRALRLDPAGEALDRLLEARAKLLLALYRGADAVVDLRRLLNRSRQSGDRRRELEALLGLASAYYIISLDDATAATRSREHYEAAYSLAGVLGDRAGMAKASIPTHHFMDYWPAERDRWLANVEEGIAIAREIGDGVLEIDGLQGLMRFHGPAGRTRLGEELRPRLEVRRDLPRLNQLLFMLQISYLGAGRYVESIECADSGMRISAELGIPPVQYPTRKAQALLGLGRYGEARLALHQEVADEAHPFGQAQQLLGIGCYEFELLAYDRAAATMRTAAHQGRSLNRGWMQRAALLFRTRALARSGRLDDAAFTEITTWLAALGDTVPAEVMAEVLFHRGTFADALAQADLGAARAAADGRLPDELSAKLVQFQTLPYLERAAEVIEPAGEAITTAESLGHLPMVWRLRAARAAAHLRLGDTVSAAVDHAVAAAALTTLAATIDDAELRVGFESDPDVAAVLAAARA